MRRPIGWAVLVALAGFALLPWNAIGGGGFFAFHWLGRYPLASDVAPALIQLLVHRRVWFAPLLAALLLAIAAWASARKNCLPHTGALLIAAGVVGLCAFAAIALAIDIDGWRWPALASVFGSLPRRQPGLGYGAATFAASMLVLLCLGLSRFGFARGNAFLACSIGAVTALIGLFTLYPMLRLFASAFADTSGGHSLAALVARLGGGRAGAIAGIVGNTVELGLLTAASATLLSLCFVTIVTRTRMPGRRVIGVLSILPMITPPFVIGLALILLFGRSGAVNALLEWGFGIRPTRWIYGLPGVWLAQTLALTPVAYLVQLGVAEGVSPTLEEASQTLGATPAQTFARVTLPLMAPGLANAFLVTFIESLADFGNPLLLGGNLEVLSTAIYFSVVGVQQDPGRASLLALVLLALSLTAFAVQRGVLGRRSFVTISGRGDTGARMPVSPSLATAAACLALPWAALAVVIYAMIFAGGFFEKWGLNHALTLRNYITAFGIGLDRGALSLSGGAWPSLLTTLLIATVAAPLTAGFGLMVAWLLARGRFAGRRLLEFVAMLNFAVPGTVVGIAYILAFNTPPIELAYSGLILVACFVFRDMTTPMRAGLAALAQVDPSLDEASETLRASTWTGIRRVLLPLLRPAVVAALVASFISAMTSVSAVVFLTSPRFDMATVNIVGRAEVGEYGYATAYASVLIALMLAAALLIRAVVGERRLLRRSAL